MTDLIDKSAGRVRAMFGQIANRYDLLNRLLSLGIDRAWRRRTVELVPPENEAPILDVCTGTADLALAYWRKTREATPIVGADFCRPMLTVGYDKLYHAGASHRVRLVEADALHLPFADNTFQIVCVAFGLRNLADTDAGLREMTRVCQPGGRVAVLEFAKPQRWPLRTIYNLYFHQVLPRVGQSLARNDKQAYRYLPDTVAQFPQGAALLERMQAAGLTATRCQRFTFGVAALSIGRKRMNDLNQMDLAQRR